MKRFLFTILICLIITSCGKDQIKSVSVKRNFTGALWIVRHNISTPEKINLLLQKVSGTNIKHLFVQVRGRGDAYYNSDYEPSADDVPEGFDPLEYLLGKTSGSDIRVHAWVNISFVMDPGKTTGEEKHLLSKHPDWITYDYAGKSLRNYSKNELKSSLVEGYFVDPAVPGVKHYTVDIVKDILSKYKVSGIHLDFIRYPYSGYNSYYKKFLSDFGYNPVAREIFKKEYGIDPVDIERKSESKEKELFDQFRRDQVTEIVRRIYNTVKSKNSDIIVSAAVMPRYDWGRRVYFQDWPKWLDEEILDIACVMSYCKSREVFENYIEYAKETKNRDKIFMGVLVKRSAGTDRAIEQIGLSYINGMRGYILFSFEHEERFLENLNSLIHYRNEEFKY